MKIIDVNRLREIAEVEFSDIVTQGSEANVTESFISEAPQDALREFLSFVHSMILPLEPES